MVCSNECTDTLTSAFLSLALPYRNYQHSTSNEKFIDYQFKASTLVTAQEGCRNT